MSTTKVILLLVAIIMMMSIVVHCEEQVSDAFLTAPTTTGHDLPPSQTPRLCTFDPTDPNYILKIQACINLNILNILKADVKAQAIVG
ncbi:hypothetical protein SAMD00019534_123710, partial [Acytostelium subglobosum LB1]|uniref:hypothetical protein n=1 Tax=Acytostelium subglobosum LB1 TaxID=1410327 RepID=UPI0006449214